MKKLVLLLVMGLISTNVFSQEKKHQVSFGANMEMAWNSAGGSAKFDSSLGVDSYTNGEGNFSINYLHTATENLQIGFIIDSSRDETEVQFDSGSKSSSESSSSSVYLLFSYNFNANLEESWYLGLGLGQERSKSKSENSSGDKTDSESTFDSRVFFLGKRFSLAFMGIENLTYSPMISYIVGDVSGDLEDDGIDEVSTLTFDILKLDLLF
jgi:hypothetical protein